jgi:hypothetical protein
MNPNDGDDGSEPEPPDFPWDIIWAAVELDPESTAL